MIELRDYRKTDADRLIQLVNNKNVSRYLVYTFPYPYTRKDAEWWIAVGATENKAITKIIEYQREFVGSVGITPQTDWRNHIAEIGYWVGEKYWRHGIATYALRKMTELAFSTNRYKKLFAPVLKPNKASIRVLKKNEYQLEGILKQEVFKDEQYFDVYHFATYC